MDTLLIVIRFAHVLAALLLFGGFLFAVLVAPAALHADAQRNALEWDRLRRRLGRIVRWCVAIAVVSAAAWFLLEAALVSGLPIGDAMALDTLGRVALQTVFGHAWLWRFAIAIALIVALVVETRAASRRWIASATILLAGLYLATLAYAGHAAAGQGADRYVRLVTDMAHLLTAGAWLGALPGFVLLLASARRTAAAGSIEVAARAARRFSVLGIASVSVLVASGLVNSWFLVGDLPHLVGTPYGRLLMTKVALFIAMLAFAAINRVSLTPRIAARDFVALRSLSRNAMLETAIGIAVVAVVAVLGVTVPAAHQEPLWPLAWTLQLVPVETAAAAGWIVAVVVTVLCAAGALTLASRRREHANGWRIASAGLAVLAAAALTCPYLSVAPAYPTTYALSPVRYTTSAIAQGAALYAGNCAQCHGARARGDGPLAASLTNKPPDLVLHAMHHPAGDMFWWIAHGIPGTAMPPFLARLPDTSIWSLIQFLRAQSTAFDATSLTTSVEPWRPLVAPDFTFEIASRVQESLKDQRGHYAVLLVLYTAPQSLERLRALALDARTLKAGLRIIGLPLGASAQRVDPAPSAMRPISAFADPDVALTYTMFAMPDETGARARAPMHAEFLIDRQGYLRARWLGVPDDDAKQTAQILEQVARLNAELPREAASDEHQH
jgi:putative copper resistance protein D